MSNQLSFVDRCVGAMAEVVLDSNSPAELWPAVLDCLERSVGFDSAFIASTTGTVTEAIGAVFGHSEAAIRANIGPYLNQITYREISGYVDRARLSHEIWDEDRLCEMSSLYAPLHPSRAKHMLVRVGYRDRILLGFNLERGAHSDPFGARELTMLDAIAPLVQVGDALWRSREDSPDVRTWVERWKLTKREADIAELVVRGLQNQEIAQALGLSRNTVRNALARVFPKAEVSTRAELAFLAQHSRDTASERPVRAVGQRSNEMDAYFERVRRASKRARASSEYAAISRDRAAFTYIAPVSAAK